MIFRINPEVLFDQIYWDFGSRKNGIQKIKLQIGITHAKQFEPCKLKNILENEEWKKIKLWIRFAHNDVGIVGICISRFSQTFFNNKTAKAYKFQILFLLVPVEILKSAIYTADLKIF